MDVRGHQTPKGLGKIMSESCPLSGFGFLHPGGDVSLGVQHAPYVDVARLLDVEYEARVARSGQAHRPGRLSS